MIKNPPPNAGDSRDSGSIPRWGNFEEEIPTHSSILAWKIPWTEEPGYNPWSHKELDMTEHIYACYAKSQVKQIQIAINTYHLYNIYK